MKGCRVHPDEKGNLPLREGDYGKDSRGEWTVRPPGSHAGGIPDHEVVEHEDGTITVTPSIILMDFDEKGREQVVWHGYLEGGVWRQV